mmetsp:Transcript_3477/g.14661  ORF Transcript_3477/g.14661 Transcript_3477/m.14661 type:complete len:238 (-) Transcript_3477:304-1017(-)
MAFMSVDTSYVSASERARWSATTSDVSHSPRITSFICTRASCSALTPSITISRRNCVRPRRPSAAVPGAGSFRFSSRNVVPLPVSPRASTLHPADNAAAVAASTPARLRASPLASSRARVSPLRPDPPRSLASPPDITSSSASSRHLSGASSSRAIASSASRSVGALASSRRKCSTSASVTSASSAGVMRGVRSSAGGCRSSAKASNGVSRRRLSEDARLPEAVLGEKKRKFPPRMD